jgi:hypothetical protein
MTDANSDSLENEDVFKRIQLSMPPNMPTISARLHELYDENVTAKIIRAGTTCLEHNVSHVPLNSVPLSFPCGILMFH